jgi:diphthamide biosynthesis methyltransferase
MELTSPQINRIKELASMLTPVSDIAVLMDIDERRLRDILSDKSHPASLAYRKGKAERALQIRQNELELAEAGSPLAVQLIGSYLRDMASDEDL